MRIFRSSLLADRGLKPEFAEGPLTPSYDGGFRNPLDRMLFGMLANIDFVAPEGYEVAATPYVLPQSHAMESEHFGRFASHNIPIYLWKTGSADEADQHLLCEVSFDFIAELLENEKNVELGVLLRHLVGTVATGIVNDPSTSETLRELTAYVLAHIDEHPGS